MEKQHSCREARGKAGLFQHQKTDLYSPQCLWLKAYRNFQEELLNN